MYPNMYNRDDIFCRLDFEKSDDLLQKLRNVDDPDFQDDKGMSYLHRACQSHYLEAIEVLLEVLELMLQHGLNLDKMEGDITLKEQSESFEDDEMNKIIKKYYHE